MADATRRVSVRLSLDDAARVKQELREVGETGQRSLERIQGGADRASRALDLLDVAVRGVQIAGLAAGLRAVVVAGDALTQSMGRLNTALGSVERAGEIYDRLYRDSLQTGVAVRESVDAFARFSIAAREIGATSDQVATLVGGLQRIAIASGASQQEIASSTQQLAQALASGTLQGDELRSILEGLPTLAQALARELGVSIGELRKLGSEGKLTADTVFPALLRAVERLNGEFERAPLSVGRAFGQLTAAADQFLARLDQVIGLSNALARALSGAARVLDGVRRGSGLLLPSEQEADRRAQAEALRAQIARLEAESEGQSLSSQPRRGSIRGGLVGTAQQQAGVDRAARLEELRRQYAELQEEIIIARNMRMEACSPMAARHTAGAQDCEYDIAWTNTYLIGIDYTATANRCGNAVINRHRAPASRFQRFLAGVPNTRAAAFRQSATEVGVEGLISIATSTTTATFMADFCFNGLTDLTPTDRAVTLAANRGLGWMLDTSQAKEFALAHWLTSGASGGRLFVRVFDGAGNVREDIAGDVLASITTMQWNGPAKGWNAGAPMDDANFNRRQTIRVGAAVAYAQVGVIGFDGPIDLQSLRLYGLPEAAPAVLNGTPLLTGALFGSGRREFAAEVSWDLPSLAPGATALVDVTVNGARAGDLAAASLVSSTRFIELDAAVWSNNTVRVMARNISAATFDLAAATLSAGVAKRRVP